MFPLCLALRQANAMASKRAAHGSSLMVNVFVRSPASSGAFLAVAMTQLLLLLSKTQSEQFAAVLLAFIGAIYVGFGLQTGTRAQFIAEWTALGFFGAAMVGLWATPWIVPAAYVVHGFWDYAHHQNSRLVPIPSWYPPLCAVLDWVAAAILTLIWGLRA
jgi:hypothetical protein